MNPDLVREFETLRNEFDDRPKPEIFSAVIDQFLSTPGLVGFWPMSSVQRSTGNAYDLSAQGRTLTYNGNPTYNIYNDFVPYIDLDGTGDYLSRADETDLDILGTETIYNSAVRGLTMGGWFWFDSLAANTTFLGKRGGTPGSGFAYFLQYDNAAGQIRNYLSVDGSALVNTSASFSTTGQWVNILARFIPSTSLDLWINGVQSTNVVGIPASIANITGDFAIGAFTGGVELMTGRASLCFLSANALSNVYTNGLFEQSRILFGV